MTKAIPLPNGGAEICVCRCRCGHAAFSHHRNSRIDFFACRYCNCPEHSPAEHRADCHWHEASAAPVIGH